MSTLKFIPVRPGEYKAELPNGDRIEVRRDPNGWAYIGAATGSRNACAMVFRGRGHSFRTTKRLLVDEYKSALRRAEAQERAQ